MVAQTPFSGGSSRLPHDEASTSAHIYMFNGINLTTRSKTYDTSGKPDKGKVTNSTDTLSDPTPSFVSPPSVNPPSGPLQIEKYTTLSYTLLRALYLNISLILVHMMPITTTLLKIWLKHRVLCLC